MSRIEPYLDELQTQNRKALIPYITAGDPYPGITVQLMHTLVAAGADVIELGIPFSDPMADGPTVQRAVENALAFGVTLPDVLSMVEQFRQQNETTPIVLMGYLNPIEHMGYQAFADRCDAVGVDGVLTVDMPPEESDALALALKAHQIDRIFLASPTTREHRMQMIAAHATGYLYYVSLKGITGSDTMDINAVTAKLEAIRSVTSIPVGVGFGIKTPEMAAAVAKVADGVVVGSAIINNIHAAYNRLGGVQGEQPQEPDVMCHAICNAAEQLVKGMREAMDAAVSDVAIDKGRRN